MLPYPLTTKDSLTSLTAPAGITLVTVAGRSAVRGKKACGAAWIITWIPKDPFLVDVRGLGLMDAIELDSRERRDRVIQGAFARGLLLLGCGYKVIRFLPPLDVRQREIDMALEILEAACKNVL